MKKILCLFLASLLIGFPSAAFAANGDIAGNIYSTDILAYVNGLPIASYNIGGKTAIVIEDLYDKENANFNYGFDWWYQDETRTLTVYSDGYTGFSNQEVSRGTVGEISGNIYETDIKVIFNGSEVPEFNIGGRTAVCIEDLGTADDSDPNWRYGYSRYLCKFVWNESDRTVSLNTYQTNDYQNLGAYPERKLSFVLTDDILTASFSQTNPYFCNLSTNFSEGFAADTFHLKDIYFRDEQGETTAVGTMYLSDTGKIYLNLSDYEMYHKTKDLAVILSYEEATDFIRDNYEILDRRSDEGGDIYLAQKDGEKYLLYALKKGGFVVGQEFSSSYTTVEFREDEGRTVVYISPFAGPHGATNLTMEVSTAAYDFYNKYPVYTGPQYSDYVTKSSLAGDAVVTVDGTEYPIDIVLDYNWKYTPMVNVDQMCGILGIRYEFANGSFIFETDGTAHTISLNTENINTPPESPLNEMIIGDVILNRENRMFSYLGGGTFLTNGQTYEREIPPVLYQEQAYVPFHFFELLYQS